MDEFPSVRGVLTAAAAVGLGFVVAVIWVIAFEHSSYNLWGAMLVVPCVLGVDALIMSRVWAHEQDRVVAWIMVLGLVAKQFGTIARYVMAYVLYGGAADAEQYNQYAAWEYFKWRDGIFDIGSQSLQGTEWMKLVTTALYTLFGPSPLAAFFVFSSFAFWGAVLLFKAFRLALPKGRTRLYAVLVFLLPSMLFWPSSLGKEAWMMFYLGVTAYGAARLFSGQARGFPLIALGLAGTMMVRPHIAVMLAMGLFVAQLFRRTGGRLSAALAKVVGTTLLGLGLYILATASTEFLGLDDLSFESVAETSAQRGENTGQGGSEFAASPVTSPLDLPRAMFTVFFRPMLWEAHNLQMIIQAVEGVALFGVVLWCLPSLAAVPRAMRRVPYVTFCVVYVLVFVWAFSGFANFAILARQRVLMLPLLAVLLALPTARSAFHKPAPAPAVRSRMGRERVGA